MSLIRKVGRRFTLTDSNPRGDVPPASQIGHEDDGDDVPDLVAAGDKAREAGGDLEPLFDGGDHRVVVPRAESLLQGHQER